MDERRETGIAFVAVICAVLAAAAGCTGSGAPVESATAVESASQAVTVASSASAEPPRLISEVCTSALDTIDREAGTLERQVARLSTRLRFLRRQVQRAGQRVDDAQSKLDSLRQAAESAEETYSAAVASLNAFLDEHGTTLPEPEYSQAQRLESEAADAETEYRTAVDAHNDQVKVVGALVKEYNARVAAHNTLVKRSRRLERRLEANFKQYRSHLETCLSASSDWDAATSRVEAWIGSLLSNQVGSGAEAACDTVPAWNQIKERSGETRYDLGGFVYSDETVAHLSPGVCFSLERLGADGAPDLACLRRSVRLNAPICAPSTEELVWAIATVAHEAEHLAGVSDEAIAQCYALQSMAGVAEQLGIAADQAQEAASYALIFTSMPPRYQSDECRDGGGLDLNQGSPPWP